MEMHPWIRRVNHRNAATAAATAATTAAAATAAAAAPAITQTKPETTRILHARSGNARHRKSPRKNFLP